MAEKKRQRAGRWIALGTVLGVVVAWGGFGVVGAVTGPPSTIQTCTKASNGTTKVITAASVSKCTKKGKGFAQTWAPASQLAVAQKRAAFWDYEGCYEFVGGCGGIPTFAGVNLHNTQHFSIEGVNLPGANLSGSAIYGDVDTVDFTGANLTNTDWFGPDPWDELVPVAVTNSDLTNANLSGAEFEVTPTDVTGTVFNHTTCPDTSLSNAHGNTCVGFGM